MPEHERRAIALQPEVETSRGALREALLVYAVVSGVTWWLSRLQVVPVPVLRTHLHLIVGTLFLVTALRCADRLPGGAARYGLALGGLFGDEPLTPEQSAAEAPEERGSLRELGRLLVRGLPKLVRELGVAASVCAVVFPPFVLGFYLWHAPTRHFVWLPDNDLFAYALTQILVVALPEEAFFRGYLQGRLADAWPKRRRFLVALLPVRPWLLQAALFAVLHVVVDYNPARLAVFFPGLLFGWVRELRGGIGAAILVHAACNLLSDVLIRGWL
ncbi:MAG: hypothetical protein RL701_949 [Pseudomonadota bacterium]|jgi:membrane protease YdiL (CAAX protease family)